MVKSSSTYLPYEKEEGLFMSKVEMERQSQRVRNEESTLPGGEKKTGRSWSETWNEPDMTWRWDSMEPGSWAPVDQLEPE